MISRRGFLKLFSLAAAAFTVANPTAEQLFEVAQKEPEFSSLGYDEISQELNKIYTSGVLDELFARENTFFKNIEKKEISIVSVRDIRIPFQIKPGSDENQ